MLNHLIGLYIAVLVCVLLISVYSAVLYGDCKNYTAHAQSIFQCNVCGKKKRPKGQRAAIPTIRQLTSFRTDWL